MWQPSLSELIGCPTLSRPELSEQHGRAPVECWPPSLHCRHARFHYETVPLMLAACIGREQMSAPPSSDWHVNDSAKTKYLDQALWPQPARSDRLLERGGRLRLLTGVAGFGFAVTAAGILCCTSFGRGLCATATGPLPTPLAAGLSCAIYTLLLCAAY